MRRTEAVVVVVDQMFNIAGVASANGVPEVTSQPLDSDFADESTALKDESAYAVEYI